MYKSPLNYLGNKYKLLPQILKLFPDEINIFYDLFCGGLDVALNAQAKKIVANDKHDDLIWLLNEIKDFKGDLGSDLLLMDKEMFPMNFYGGKSIKSYSNNTKTIPQNKEIWQRLLKEKRTVYQKIRDEFNESLEKDFKIVLLLLKNSVGLTDFRMKDMKCMLTCGDNSVNKNAVKQLNEFGKQITKIELQNDDFRRFYDVEYNAKDFVYLDPPYLKTSQYKVKWSEQDEIELYKFIDYLDRIGVKFALSNFADGVNHTNTYLSDAVGKYNIHKLDDDHSNLSGTSKKGTRQEILVTNY